MIQEEVIDRIVPFSGYDSPGQQGAVIHGSMEPGNFAPVQQVKAPYTTAVRVQEKRSISRLTMNVLQEAGLAGAKFFYRWTVKAKDGEKVIQGPSIDLAMCMVRNFGNCALDVEVQETPTHYLFKGILIDLESGFTCPRLFRQRKQQSIGKRYDSERQEDIVFQIGQSKAIRNAITHYMPKWLIDQAIEAAYNSEVKSIRPENMATARANCIRFFAGHGVTQEQIEAKIGRKADNWTETDIVDMRAAANAIKEGRITAQEMFEPAEITTAVQDPGEPVTTKAEEQQPPIDKNWDKPNWLHLKSPGVQAHAQLFKNTFKDLPPAMREQFKIKWGKCSDLGLFPFDDNGNWIGSNAAAALDDPSPEPPPVDEPSEPKTDWTEIDEAQFKSWFETNYPRIPVHRMNNFLEELSEIRKAPAYVFKNRMMEDNEYLLEIIESFNQWITEQR